MHSIAQLPFLPLSLHTLSEALFFVSDDPGVVRAGFLMLEAAWRSSRPGSIPSSFSELATITRLPIHQIEAHYAVLTAGWELLDDGRLHHASLETICESIQDRFSDQLDVLAEASAAAVQGGALLFELVPAAEVTKKKRGKHLLPKDFSFNKVTQAFAHTEGFSTPEYQTWLMRGFTDYANSKSVMYTDWQAACRQFMSSEITRKGFKSRFHHFPGEQMPTSVAKISSASDRLRAATNAATFQQRTMQANSDKMHDTPCFMTEVASTPPAPASAAMQDSFASDFRRRVVDVSDAEFVMSDSHQSDMQQRMGA